MSIPLNDNIYVQAPKPVEPKSLKSDGTVFASVAEANSLIPIGVRYLRLTVQIGPSEYWYYNGVQDSDLILKQQDASAYMLKADYDPNDDGIVNFTNYAAFEVQLAVAVSKGTPLYVSSASSSTIIVGKAQANDNAKMPCVGLALSNGNIGDTIKCGTIGLISGVDTSSYPTGTSLYVATSGGYTNVKPSVNPQFIGFVVNSDAIEGSISICVDAIYIQEAVNWGGIGGNINLQTDLINYIAEENAETLQAANAYADSLVVGLWDDRGNYNASSNLFPSTGGSGPSGDILKGDVWTISVAGTLGGQSVIPGDTVRALVDLPGQTASNWAIAETNIGYVPENVANKTDNVAGNEGSSTLYASLKGFTTWIVNNLVPFLASKASVTTGDSILIGDGADSNKTKKIAWTDFLASLNLSFLQRSNNLSDVSNVDTARNNLKIYNSFASLPADVLAGTTLFERENVYICLSNYAKGASFQVDFTAGFWRLQGQGETITTVSGTGVLNTDLSVANNFNIDVTNNITAWNLTNALLLHGYTFRFRRSDGQNRTLTFGTGSSVNFKAQYGLKFNLTDIIAWVTGTTYQAGMIISYSGKFYYRTNVSTGFTTSDDPTTATTWWTETIVEDVLFCRCLDSNVLTMSAIYQTTINTNQGW